MENIKIEKYKRYFKEMAYKRSQIEQEIRSSNRTRREHLILIYLFPKHISNNHWQSEIKADLLDIASMKWSNNNKYLSEKEYFDNLWNRPYENNDNYEVIDISVEELSDDYPIKTDWKKHKKSLVIAIKNFYIEISKLIANGSLKGKTIYELLEKFKESR